MRNRSVAFVALFLALACAASLGAAEPVTVALSDFAVNSANPGYAYLGKGFAEIVAFELKKSKDLRLVDRERRNELLSEMEFSLTGLTDPTAQLEMGKLLSVRYLVGGSITDMGGPLLVSLSMVDVESGEVVWRDQVTESGGKYAYIGAYFGKSLLRHFQVQVAKSTEASLAKAKEADAASVVALSAGIAALDKGDKAKAKKELALAKKIDPANAVAGFFLSRLASASAKFKVVPERYVSYYNPAYLGGMEKDRAFGNYTTTFIVDGEKDANNGDGLDVLEPGGEYGTRELLNALSFGYAAPVSAKVGLGIDVSSSFITDMIVDWRVGQSLAILGNDQPMVINALATLGAELGPNVSLGAGLSAGFKNRRYYLMSWPLDEYRNDPSVTFGGLVGFVLKTDSGGLAWDVEAAYDVERMYWYDPVLDVFNGYNAPLYVEQTLTLALNEKRTFLALKQANDIYLDRDLYYGRAMPCLEQWFGDGFTLRVGAEGTLFALDGDTSYGWGGTAGLTARFAGLDLDANFTYRMRPSRTLADTVIPEGVVFVTVSKSGLFRK